MPVHFTFPFLDDLKKSNDAKFIRRVLDHVIGQDGQFEAKRDDHRYRGIQDAWIRYVSAGTTAYRVIYIQKGNTVYLYRAGHHSVEDNLSAPTKLSGVALEDLQATTDLAGNEKNDAVSGVWNPSPHKPEGIVLTTSRPQLIRKIINSLFFVAHHEIVLVSPYYSEKLLDKHQPFGRFLDRAIEEDTLVTFITKPSDNMDLDFFGALENRGICVYFHNNLHAKLYLFDVDETSTGKFTKDVRRTAILGSANLTDSGLSLDGGTGNEEMCYRLPHHQYDEARNHATWLITQSTDYTTYRTRKLRRF